MYHCVDILLGPHSHIDNNYRNYNTNIDNNHCLKGRIFFTNGFKQDKTFKFFRSIKSDQMFSCLIMSHPLKSSAEVKYRLTYEHAVKVIILL